MKPLVWPCCTATALYSACFQTCHATQGYCQESPEKQANDGDRVEAAWCTAVSRLDTLYGSWSRAAHSAFQKSPRSPTPRVLVTRFILLCSWTTCVSLTPKTLKLMTLACFQITLCCESLVCDVLVVYVIDVLLFEHHNTKPWLVEVSFMRQTKHAFCWS